MKRVITLRLCAVIVQNHPEVIGDLTQMKKIANGDLDSQVEVDSTNDK